MATFIDNLSSAVDRFCRSTAVAFLACMLLLVVFQVIARYLFQAVPVWTEEAARFCMVWAGLLGATIAFRADTDPRLFKPPREGSGLKILFAGWLRALAVVVFLGPVLYHSGSFIARTMRRSSEALEIPLGWVTLAVPISVVIIFFHLLARLLKQK